MSGCRTPGGPPTGVRQLQVSVLGSTPEGPRPETPSLSRPRSGTATPVAALVSAGSTWCLWLSRVFGPVFRTGFIILPPDQIRLLDTALALVTSTGTARPV